MLLVDARSWLREESLRERRPVQLDSVSAASLDRIAELCVGWVWLRGIWDPGDAARECLSRCASAVEHFSELFADFEIGDIDAPLSCIRGYRVREEFGGEEGLESFRAELAARNLHLILDFEADRVAVDHPWTQEHPEFFISGDVACPDEGRLEVFRTPAGRAIAHVPVQDAEERFAQAAIPLLLDLRHPAARRAVLEELAGVLARSDGVYLHAAESSLSGRPPEPWSDFPRLPDGSSPSETPFLLDAARTAREVSPDSLVLIEDRGALRGLAEEASCVRCVDCRMPELLRQGDPLSVAEYLAARGERGDLFIGTLEFGMEKCAVLPPERRPAAAIVACFSSGGALFWDWEVEGRTARADPRLRRRALGAPDRETQSFYETILEILARPEASRGERRALRPREAWGGNTSYTNFFAFLAHASPDRALLAVVNFGPERAQCYLDLDPFETVGREWVLQDLLSLATYVRDGDELKRRGLYIELEGWDYNVFEMTPARKRGEDLET